MMSSVSSVTSVEKMLLLLNVANLERLLHRCQGIAFRDELLRHEALVAKVGDRLHDGTVVELLRLIDLVASGNAAGMKMCDVCVVRANVPDDIAFHDLHVVDVEEELEAR